MFPFSSYTFSPEKDIPALTGKTIIITGGNSGLGLESLIQLAKHSPSKIYLCARSKEKYDAAMKHIAESGVSEPGKFVHFLELDLQSLASVRKSAETFVSENSRLDVLMNNAG
jgi:retinol dehydrogenase-12